MLDLRGFDTPSPEGRVVILVGPNGSGKSRYLRKLALSARKSRSVAIICNTFHDRFSGLRGVPRLSPIRGGSSADDVVKEAITLALSSTDSRFYQISTVLEMCGYFPRFGFRIKLSEQNLQAINILDLKGELLEDEMPDFDSGLEFLRRYVNRPDNIIWLDPTGSAFDYSRANEVSAVLRREATFRKHKIVKRIEIFLQREDSGATIRLSEASSGEISLISNMAFLISKAKQQPLIVIDEPENSLHPAWQRKYTEMVLAAMPYSQPTLVIATHSPLILTGAIAEHRQIVSIFAVHAGELSKIEWNEKDPNRSIEQVLWDAFEVVTPASHFVSQKLTEAFDQFQLGTMEKGAVLSLIADLEAKSFDHKQVTFFEAAKKLLDKVEAEMKGAGQADG